jgi:hypothetical protein
MGAPALGVNFDGRMEVFAVGLVVRRLHHPRTPDVALNQDGRMEVFVVRASDGVLQHAWQVAQNGSWSSLTALPGISVIPE